MMTWAMFLNEEAGERLAWTKSMAVGLSAVLHAALILAVFAELSQPSAATGDAGIDVTFEPAAGIEQASTATTPEPAPPSTLVLSEPTPGEAPAKEPEVPLEPQLALSQGEPAMEKLREQPEVPIALAPPPPIESQPEQEASVALSPPVQARLEDVLPGVESPPLVDAHDFPRAKPAPPKAQVAAVQPPAGKRIAPDARPGDSQGVGSTTAAGLRSDQVQRKVEEDYFWQIVRRISQYRFYSRSQESAQQGMVVTRMTIARDGRLLDVALLKSSGFPTLDSAVIETIRRASPFAPLPSDLGREQQTFVVPVNYTRER